MRKGSANMWWIIIGAVIALVVMIVLMVMFTGKTGALEGGLLSCEGKGGTCEVMSGTTCGESCKGDTSYSSLFTCDSVDGTAKCCCLGVKKKAAGASCTSGSECLSNTCTATQCT